MTESMAPRTTTHGFLFADLRGYSAYVETHGDHAGAELLRSFRALVRAEVARHEGAEIRTEGDSFYVVFPSASRAVTCAMAILAAAGAAEPPFRVGIGIHAGETVDTGESPVGSAVNISARVCAQAGAGELLVTDTVRALTRTLVPYRFIPRGTPVLKGISEPMALFRVVEPDDPAALVPAKGKTRRVAGPGQTTSLALVAGATAIALVGLGLLYAFVTRPTGTGAATASPTPAGATAGATATGGLSAAEADLVSRLSFLEPAERATCRAGTAEERASGAVASVTCPLPSGSPAASVHVDLFDQPAVMLTTYDAFVRAHGDPTGDCASAALGGGTWAVTGVSQGHLLCYPDAGTSHVIWTYEGDISGLIGSAVRADSDWHQLFAWWQEIHPLIAH